MPVIFKSQYSDNQYYRVESRTSTTVQARTHTTWPLHDKKGRAIGFGWSIFREVTVLQEGEAQPGKNGLHPIGDPLDVFVATGCQTRNGERYGSGDIVVRGTDLEAVRVEMLKRIDRARNAAAKKWAPKV